MTLFRLQHHRTRVPAIPPSTRHVTHRFTIEERDAALDNGGHEWRAFLQCMGLNPNCPYTTGHLEAAFRAVRERGFKITLDRFPSRQSLLITVTQPPRIAQKLLATFPWKLRRLLSESPHQRPIV